MMKNRKNDRMMIFCEPCSFKAIIHGQEDLKNYSPIQTASIPGGAPELDQNGKKKVKPSLENVQKVKCPKCGRGVVVKTLSTPYSSAYKHIDEEKEKKRLEDDRLQRIKDGVPVQKVSEPTDQPPQFLG